MDGPMLFDSHLHLIDRDSLDYPWLENVEALNRDHKFDDYSREAARLGIVGCLHMEVDVAEGHIQKETDMMTGLIGRPGSLMHGVISSCRPEEEGFAAFLEHNLQNPAVKGFRRVLHVVPDEVSTATLFRENINRLKDTGLTFDICMLARQLGLAKELVDHCPQVTFVLDHCGVPDIASGRFEDWQADMAELAKRPNVFAKISGIVAYADPDNWALADIRPYFESTAEAFGADRIVWGSDCPVCNLGGGMAAWVAATRAITADWSAAERDGLYSANAKKLWQI